MELTNIDWMAILKIIGIDIMLGVDNAVVIALACASLPIALRNKAILLGTAGAVCLRAILLVFAGLLFGLPFVKLIAGAYLIYIGYSLLVSNSEDDHCDSPDKMFNAIKTIIVADFMMSLDNVLAVVGASQSAGEHSTLYAIAGIALSIPIIVFGAQLIMKMMDKYPFIIWIGAGLLGWIGAEMIVSEHVLPASMTSNEEFHLYMKILGFFFVIAAAATHKFIKAEPSRQGA